MVWEIWPFEVQKFWEWFDHNLPTIHGNWVFLDFLEMGEQDLQLSCWAKIHLKLVSWCKFEDQDFPFLVSFSYRSSFHFWKFLIWLQILPWWCLTWYMRPIWTWMRPLKPISIIKLLIKWTVDQQLTFRVSDCLLIDWWLPNPNSLRTWLQMMSQVVWTLDYWSWCPNSTRMATIHCFDWLLTV